MAGGAVDRARRERHVHPGMGAEHGAFRETIAVRGSY